MSFRKETSNELEDKISSCVSCIMKDESILYENKESLLDWYNKRISLNFVEKHIQCRWVKELEIYPNSMLIDRLKAMQRRLEESYSKC